MSEPAAVTVDEGAEVRSWGWHVLQVSSWVLVVLLPLHLVSIWLTHDAGRVGVAFYVQRWHSSTWRIVDWLFFMLALAHGGLGVHGMLAPRAADRRVRIALALALALVLGGLAVALSAAIFSFDVT